MKNEKSEQIVTRIRAALKPWKDKITEKRMFGGYCFLYNGKMCVGETKFRLMVRVPGVYMNDILKEPHVGPMDFTGRPLKEFIFVAEPGYDTEEKLQRFVEYGIAHAKSKTEG